MKDKLVKKRRKVDWYALRLELGDPDVEYYYWLHFGSGSYSVNKKKLSLQRRSFYALLHVYGRDKLLSYRLTGEWL